MSAPDDAPSQATSSELVAFLRELRARPRPIPTPEEIATYEPGARAIDAFSPALSRSEASRRAEHVELLPPLPRERRISQAPDPYPRGALLAAVAHLVEGTASHRQIEKDTGITRGRRLSRLVDLIEEGTLGLDEHGLLRVPDGTRTTGAGDYILP